MNPVSDRRRDHVELTHSEEPAPRTPSAPARTARAPSDGRLRATVGRLPLSTEYRAFLAHLPEVRGAALASSTLQSARDAAMQQRLDAFRDRFSGPYVVLGASVIAKPMFRMNTANSFNAKKMEAHAPELSRICAKAGIASAAGPARYGRCSPEQLVKVTQALIDAGKLPPADDAHQDLANRIRGMQWEWGIGVDCAGYTQQAAADAHGAAGVAFKSNLMGDIFSGMANDRRFAKVDPANIRPGDVIHLDAPKRGEVGHNVICFSHSTLDDAARAKLLASPATDAGKAFLRGAGPFHTFEVDSSWGAGDGTMVGGFRRDTWLYDESTFTWASYPSGQRELPLHADPLTGPQGELFAGAFRPRDAR